MAKSNSAQFESGSPQPESQKERLNYLEERVRALEERAPEAATSDGRFLSRKFVAPIVVILLAFVTLLFVLSAVGGISMLAGRHFITPGLYSDKDTLRGASAPRLDDVSTLLSDKSSVGVLQGVPTGASVFDAHSGSFEMLVFAVPDNPYDQALVTIFVDDSTRVYRGTQFLDDFLSIKLDTNWPIVDDPTAAPGLTVHFSIEDERLLAERIVIP